ncbi:MAG: nucleotidyltransferase domain-containing protein [Elusimicrobia bacterium]|nr:nucleotidyltransferase domain-containing protein [Elusimicrobiota bacterium]
MNALKLAENTIKAESEKMGINVVSIILFGSRAKNQALKESDWDFLVIVDKTLNFQEMKALIANIKWCLAELKIPNDIIIRSKKKFEYYKNMIGNVSFYANKEGKFVWTRK